MISAGLFVKKERVSGPDTSIFLANRDAIRSEFWMIVCQKGTCVRSGHTSIFLANRDAPERVQVLTMQILRWVWGLCLSKDTGRFGNVSETFRE